MKTALSVLAILVVMVAIIRTIPHAEAATAPALAPISHRAYDPNLASQEVQFNLGRVQRDPGGAIGWRQLASAYLAAGREKDSSELAKKSEQAAIKSLAIRTPRNASAAVILSEALLEQHRFGDALVACQKSLEIEPENDFAERTLTDIYFEIGRYDDACKLIGKHPEWNEDPGGLALLARQFELTGRSDEALVSLKKATEQAESDSDLPGTTVSWFHIKYGDLLARNGKLPEANGQYETALKLNPGSWKALASMARLKAMQGDHAGVQLYGEKLNAIAPMTDVIGLMQDAALAQGDAPKASKYSSQIVKMNQAAIDAGMNPKSELDMTRGHTHDRMFSVYLADHNQMLPLAQHAATHDLANRKDIYAYDTYAWATYKLALAPKDPKAPQPLANTTSADYRLVEAKQCIDKAMAQGTQDAKIFFHAGMIELALGKKDLAKQHLAKAIAINSNFNPDQVKQAREVLTQ